MNAAMVQSLFFLDWSDGAASSCDFFTEVVKNAWFERCSWIDFAYGIDVDCAASCLVARADNRVHTVLSIGF